MNKIKQLLKDLASLTKKSSKFGEVIDKDLIMSPQEYVNKYNCIDKFKRNVKKCKNYTYLIQPDSKNDTAAKKFNAKRIGNKWKKNAREMDEYNQETFFYSSEPEPELEPEPEPETKNCKKYTNMRERQECMGLIFREPVNTYDEGRRKISCEGRDGRWDNRTKKCSNFGRRK